MIDELIVMTEVALELCENNATHARTQAKRMNTAAHAELVISFIKSPPSSVASRPTEF